MHELKKLFIQSEESFSRVITLVCCIPLIRGGGLRLRVLLSSHVLFPYYWARRRRRRPVSGSGNQRPPKGASIKLDCASPVDPTSWRERVAESDEPWRCGMYKLVGA